MAPGADPAFEQAMDNLLLQVNTDNVLAVRRAFDDHAKALRSELQQISANIQIGLCGLDPISRDAAGPASFGGKAQQLLDVHWRHCEELEAVASRLQETARSYGHTEEEIANSLNERPQR